MLDPTLLFVPCDIPELLVIPPKARRLIQREFKQLREPNILGTSFFNLIIGVAAAYTIFVAPHYVYTGANTNAWTLTLGMAVTWMFILVVLIYLQNRERRSMFRAFVAIRFPAGRLLTCHQCGYDLRQSPGPNCPECGTAIATWTPFEAPPLAVTPWRRLWLRLKPSRGPHS